MHMQQERREREKRESGRRMPQALGDITGCKACSSSLLPTLSFRAFDSTSILRNPRETALCRRLKRREGQKMRPGGSTARERRKNRANGFAAIGDASPLL